jgi:hypothetical protein
MTASNRRRTPRRIQPLTCIQRLDLYNQRAGTRAEQLDQWNLRHRRGRLLRLHCVASRCTLLRRPAGTQRP